MSHDEDGRNWCPACHEYFLECEGCGEAMVTDAELRALAHADEPQGVHPLSCAVWTSSDPTAACDCGADNAFTQGVDAKLAMFQRYEAAS